MKIIYLRYESDGRIGGFYSTPPHGNYITVTTEQKNLVIKYPQCFTVIKRKLVQTRNHVELEESLSALNKKRAENAANIDAVNGNLEVDDIVFHAKPEFIQQINLNLSICSINSKHTTKMWGQVEGVWEFRSLDKDDLLAIAIAYDSKRIKLLKDIH